jgi:aryl-alcohol dehydrogenase-like predicted oxidoreductase
MRYRRLGKSDLSVSEVSIGCMSLGSDDATNKNILHRAFDLGINYFDTADIYQNGNNEVTVGKAFNDRRDKVIIATKVGNQLRHDGQGFDWNPSKSYILQGIEKSLTRLQTDYIDLYQLHGGTLEDPIDEIIEALELLKSQGKIRYYGISSIRPNVIREYAKRSSIISVMMQYSVIDRRPEESCLDLLHSHSISVVARGALAKGLLINKPAEAYLNYSLNEVEKVQKAIQALSTKQSATDTAIQFVLRHPAVTSAVIGTRTVEQVTALRHASNSSSLTANELNQLENIVQKNKYEQHR